jgi:hypothetical protein
MDPHRIRLHLGVWRIISLLGRGIVADLILRGRLACTAELLRRSFDDFFVKMRRSFSIPKDKTLADVLAEESEDQGSQP